MQGADAMSAVVVDIRPHQARRRARVTLSDQLTQAVMAECAAYPLAAIEAGLAEGNRLIAERCTFDEAFEHARLAVLRAAGDRNAERLAEFYARREKRTQSYLRAIEGVLRKTRAPDEIAPALLRARRALAGGGNFCSALLLAFWHEGAR